MATVWPEPRRTVADVIVGALLDAGVRTLFGVPGGGSNLDLIAAAGQAGLPFVLTATESAAAIAALAQAEVIGQPGACLTTLGPGVASVVNGVACAFLERAPIVVFTDGHPAAASGAYAHQRLDHPALLGSITKSSDTMTASNTIEVLARALRTACEGQPGPVHLDCPGDVAASSLTAGSPDPLRQGHEFPPEPFAEAERLREALRRSHKPLLLIGLGARRPDDARAIRDLCEHRRIPAMVTYKAKGVVPDASPWFAGVFTNASIEQPVIDESDLLIGIGLDPVELIPRRWQGRPPIVHVGPWRVEDAQVPFDTQTVISGSGAAALLDRGLPVSDWDPARIRQHVDDQRQRILSPAGGGTAGQLTAQDVVSIAADRMAGIVGRVTVDAGAHMFPVTTLWPVRAPNEMLISNGLSTMGFALPAAIGAALVERDKPVVALTGDGGLLMCMGELLTAARERVRVITIVFSDASLSLIEIKQQARRLASAGVALGKIDWPALAASFGVAAWTASSTTELQRAIDAALQSSGPALIEATIDRSNYGATLRAVRG